MDDVDGGVALFDFLFVFPLAPTSHTTGASSAGMFTASSLMLASTAVHPSRLGVLRAPAGGRPSLAPLCSPAVARMTNHIMTPLL